MRVIQHHITEKQYKKLHKLSKIDGVSVAELIRRAIDKEYGNDLYNVTREPKGKYNASR